MPEFWLQHCVKGKNESKTDRSSFAIEIAKMKFNRRKTDEEDKKWLVKPDKKSNFTTF